MITLDKCKEIIAKAESAIEPAMLLAFIKVESGGIGFDSKTKKLLIQFEPVWFKKLTQYNPSGEWSVNKVDVQSKEWLAFNDAFKLNPDKAMESTSIGLPQIMGFHWKRLGYSSVGAMWDDFKKGEDNQVLALVKFLETDTKLRKAILTKDFVNIANIYNGPDWHLMAEKYGRVPYPTAIKNEYLANGGKV